MAYTLYEFQTVTPTGEPVQPAAKRTASQALSASVRLQLSTVYVAVVPDADMYLRIDSAPAQAATSADYKCLSGVTYGFPVTPLSQPYLYGL